MISPLSWANTMVILLSVAITLLFWRNKWILFYQSLNFIWSPSNHSRSGTMFFSITVYSNIAGTGTDTIDIFSLRHIFQ